MSTLRSARLARLAEELAEAGLPAAESPVVHGLLVEEIDHALRPAIHERRVASSGVIVEPRADPGRWPVATTLDISHTPLAGRAVEDARRFADGLSSWLVRRSGGGDEFLLFDRPAGSERDLLILAGALDGIVVQRHPSGAVRVAGGFGVLRWEGFDWHHEPPVSSWSTALAPGETVGDRHVLEALLEFAVHDLGARGIGALLVYRRDDAPGPVVEEREPEPPPLRIGEARHRAPLRHALAQIDGAAVFDAAGTLRRLGVRLIPSTDAEDSVDPLRGTRHTSGRRYSYDDPSATVIAVSEDGPVTVMRAGAVLGRSGQSE